jgi:hypothetical protein
MNPALLESRERRIAQGWVSEEREFSFGLVVNGQGSASGFIGCENGLTSWMRIF